MDKNVKPIHVLIAIFVIAIMIVIATNIPDKSRSNSESSNQAGIPDPSQTWQVQYKVSGSARSANITISVPGGGTEQRPVTIPYTSPMYSFKGWDSVYVSAQNNGEYGSVIAEIVVNGSVLKTATSQGEYSIASVSWLAGSK
jgi:hypothetical protein